MKGILAILLMLGVLTQDSGMYMVLSAVADAVFYFLPIFLGYNMTARLGADPFLGLVIGASLVYPTLQGVDIELFSFTLNEFFPALRHHHGHRRTAFEIPDKASAESDLRISLTGHHADDHSAPRVRLYRTRLDSSRQCG